ncbi:hypothetical protein CSHISOI_05998 [Colletotrichum shisoi]|uniref:Uncharacterized protein n=1 Tax=Colletotrichum shisoi TaxID=2078593 RepID=A0A5Q4BS28_9PEZI|nr:hypothetical protein CSHISOI_05998 [Colletotrichum shisoi]
MAPFVRALALLALPALVLAQDEPKGDGYFGYDLKTRGDDNESAVYETANTNTGGGVALDPTPDVYLNASVSVGEISVEVLNLTAKVNVDAKVLNLLHFQAGVDARIGRVKLGIYNVSARVELEARLGNVVKMVDDVLTSIDLNPIIATLGDTVSDVVDGVADAVENPVESGSSSGGSSSSKAKRDLAYRLENNILYSVNDFSGRTHTNRVLAQNGSLYDVRLDNGGNERGRSVVGHYSRDMTFGGHNRTVEGGEFELQYLYAPYAGLEAFCNIYVDAAGRVVRTRVEAEAEGGGTATIGNDAGDR